MVTRYQVFVSSTYLDLKDERKKIEESLLRMQCIPEGMELWPAKNESQWDIIKAAIQTSDIYLVVIGGRYGSICAETELSYTEMEFDYAVSIGKPVIALLHKNPIELPAEKYDFSRQEQLQKFREKASNGREVGFWSDIYDLTENVLISVHQVLMDAQAKQGYGKTEDLLLCEPESCKDALKFIISSSGTQMLNLSQLYEKRKALLEAIELIATEQHRSVTVFTEKLFVISEDNSRFVPDKPRLKIEDMAENQSVEAECRRQGYENK